MPPLQPYVSNTPLVVAKNLRFLTEAGIIVTEMLPIGMVGNIVIDSPTTGYISRIGAILSDQIDLYNNVNNILIQYQGNITSLDQRVTALEISGTTVPYVNGYCYNGSSAILVTDMVELLTQDLCDYKPVLGTSSALTSAILAETPGFLNPAPAFSQNSAMSGLTGWVTSPGTVADAINNLWISYLDSRTGITNAIGAITPTCSQVIIDFSPIVKTSSAVNTAILVFFSGYSFIPPDYTDPGNNSTINITDGQGNRYSAAIDIVGLSTPGSASLDIILSSTSLSTTTNYYTVTIESYLQNSTYGITCQKTVIHNTTTQGGSPCGSCCPYNVGTATINEGTVTSFVLISELTYTPSFVSVQPGDGKTATLLAANPYFITFNAGGATINFGRTVDTSGTLIINYIAYK